MTLIGRITNIVTGIVMILVGIILVLDTEDSYLVVIAILGLTLLAEGVRSIIFYFSMARNMVGGRAMLYKGAILMDFGVFTLTLNDVPRGYVLLYLISIHAFAGLVDILRALEAARLESHWKLTMAHGVVNFVMALLCIIFLKSPNTVIYIYASGLVYSAFFRIARAFRRNRIVFIQ